MTLRHKSIHLMLLLAFAVGANSASAEVREYWIAADEVMWDYAPSYPTNLMTGEEFTPEQKVFVEPGPNRKGHVYLKAIYQQYTPGFGSLIPKPQHLGTLGPIIRAVVGDEIVVHFKNNTRFPASVHPHGVFYDKNSEGAPYADGTNLKADDIVAPLGGVHTYRWMVPERAGPGPADTSSVVWVYHSHVDEPADTNAGLIGPMFITRKGMANADGSPKDVNREFVSLFTVFDENASGLAEVNLAALMPSNQKDLEGFEESNLMHGINGLVYGNNEGYVMRKGEKVRWYIIGMGTEVDLHSPHWHGVTALHHGIRLDVSEILPAATKTFDLDTDNPGTWMFHCHVNDHIIAGMMTKFTIQP